jgi:hypothetical protein
MSKPAPTYTLDAEKDGQFFEDHGLTAEQIAAARANAPRLGITIISVTEEVAVSPADLAPFGIAAVSS